MKEYLPWIVAGALAIMLFMDRCSNREGGASPDRDTIRIETHTQTIYDSVIIHHWHAAKEVFIKDTTQKISDRDVLNDYYVRREYDTSHADSAGSWRARAIIWQNRIQDFRIDLQSVNTSRQITLAQPASVHIWLGAFIGGRQTFDYGPQAIITDKKSRAYTVNYSLADKSVRIGLGLKLK